MAKQLARELINAGVHFGHGVSRWNPKMAPYIFAKRGTIHIIDVKKTLMGILVAKKLLAEIVSSGGDVVFVGTKRQAQKAVEAAAGDAHAQGLADGAAGEGALSRRTVDRRGAGAEVVAASGSAIPTTSSSAAYSLWTPR